jgi:hypothetical protein
MRFRITVTVVALLLARSGSARAEFFNDVRRTFQTDIPHFFQDDVPCAFGGQPTSHTKSSCKSGKQPAPSGKLTGPDEKKSPIYRY